MSEDPAAPASASFAFSFLDLGIHAIATATRDEEGGFTQSCLYAHVDCGAIGGPR